LIFVILYFSLEKVKENTIQNLNIQINHLNRAVVLQTKHYLISGNFSSLDSLVKVLGSESESRFTVILPDGTVVADSDKDPKSMENHLSRTEIIDAKKGGSGSSMRYSYSINQRMLYNAITVLDGTRLLGFARVSLPIKYLDDLYFDLAFKIISITAIIFAIALIILFLFSKSISRNINKLVSASNKIADGDFDSRVYLNTRDELSKLGTNFNNMSEKLKDSFSEIQRKEEEVSSIIKSMRDAIVVIDEKDRIVLCNDNFKSYFSIESVENNYYWEIIRNPDFQKIVKKIQSKQGSKITELHHNGNYYLASASWNSLKREVVIIIYDINEMKRLEEVKRDFITNVSHELKTPLTAIKGFVETMQDDANDEQKYYLSIIERQTQRLILIVQDLLLLARLENPETRINKKPLKLSEVCDNIFKLFETKGREKPISLVKKIPNDTELIADEFMLEQLLINLIENSWNYSESGNITVSAIDNENTISLIVLDTGMGIPKEHLPRIFERFYTVDKSHSKAISGTGLGLSIVKHIAASHSADVKCDSTVGEGTQFTITFNK
jgi:two-component system phosphate regulon sensor histidine kinase PhoR